MKKFLFLYFLLFLVVPAYADEHRAVAILLDISKSIPPADFQQAKESIAQLIGQSPSTDSISVHTFGNELQTINPGQLKKLKASESYTMLYDATYDVAQDLVKQSANRKAILIVSDGYDTKSVTILEDTVSYANANGIAIYGIGVGKVNRKALERIAKLTGGRFSDLHQSDLIGQFRSALASQKEVTAKVETVAAAPAQQAETAQPVRVNPPSAPTVALPQPEEKRGISFLWIAFILAAVVMAGVIAFGIIRSQRPAVRTCPTCGRRLEPYQTICPNCSGAKTIITPKLRPVADGTQEIKMTMEEEAQEQIPIELLEKKPVTEEMLSKTFVLMETPMLVVRKGKNPGQSFSLNRAFPISIGRSKVNEILVDDVTISGQHCRIIPENGRHVLYDLGSTNGTFVNAKKVTRVVLKEGDTIKVGETQFLYKIEQHRSS